MTTPEHTPVDTPLDLETRSAQLREALANRQQSISDESVALRRGDRLVFDGSDTAAIVEDPDFYAPESLSDEQDTAING